MKVIKFPNKPQGEFNEADQAFFNRSWINWCENNNVNRYNTPPDKFEEYYSNWREQFRVIVKVTNSREIGEA